MNIGGTVILKNRLLRFARNDTLRAERSPDNPPANRERQQKEL